MNNLESVVGKNFDFKYWKNVYTNDDIKNCVTNLRLAHLKHAIDFNLITNNEHLEYRKHLTDHYRPCEIQYKPRTLMDFCKVLKTSNKLFKPHINCENSSSKNEIVIVQSSVMHASEHKNQHNESITNLPNYYQVKESEGQTKKPKTLKKKKKRKKLNIHVNNDSNYMKNRVDEVQLHEINYDVESKSKDSVKIFVRKMDKIYNNEMVQNKSTKMSVRDVFSKILKQYKEKIQKNL